MFQSKFIVSLLGLLILVGCSLPRSVSQVAELRSRKPIKAPESEAQAAIAIANTAYAEDKIEEALAQYERIVRQWPAAKRELTHRMAVANWKMGKTDQAEQLFTDAIAYDPNNSKRMNDLGYFLMQEGRLEDARVQFTRALHVDPSFQLANNNLAELFALEQKYDQSIAQYQKTLDSAHAYANAGSIAAREGDLAFARQALAMAVKKDPGLRQAALLLTAIEDKPDENLQIASRQSGLH